MWDVWFDDQIVYSKIEHLSNIDEIISFLKHHVSKLIGFLLFGPYFPELSVRRTCVIESQDLKKSALFCCPFDRFKIKLIELSKSLDQLANRLFVKFGYCVDKLV